MIKVSIVIINYNYGKYLSRCINSAISQQTNINYEIIIVDDGSQDSSKNIINSFLKYKKIRVFFLKNKGIEFASNFGLKKAKGKYVVRLDSDDFMEKNYIRIVYKKINNSNFAFVYSNYKICNQKGKIIKKKKLPNFNYYEIINRGDFLATGTMYNKSIIEKLGYYSTKIKNCGLENYELIIKLIKKGHRGFLIKKTLFCCTRHKKNFSSNNFKKIMNFGKNLFKRCKIGVYKININHPANIQ